MRQVDNFPLGFPPPELRGKLRRGVLWLLMENGTASAAQLTSWLGAARPQVGKAVTALQKLGLVARAKVKGGALYRNYGLTTQGIEIAIHIEDEDWLAHEPAAGDTTRLKAKQQLGEAA